MTTPAATAEPLDLRLVPAAVTAWVVAWQVRVVPPLPVVVLAAVAAAAGVLLLLWSPRRGSAGLAAALLCAAAAGTCTAARVHARTSGPLPDLAGRGAAVAVEAVLTDDPRETTSTSPAPSLVVARVRVERVTAAGRSHELRAPVLVLTQERAWLGLLPGQHLSVEGRLRAAEAGDDVGAVLSARGRPLLRGRPDPAQRVAGRLRRGLRDAVSVLPAAERGLLPGLVVGDTARLDPALREDFRSVGLTHLLAVSGTNCAVVAGAVLLLGRRLGLGLRASPGLAAVALLGFVVLARPSPSVLRAAVMGAVGLVGLATGSRRAALPALAGSVLLLVLLDPDLAATAGFALSVLATGGILLLAPGWRDALARRLPRWLAEALAVPAAAQVTCGPVVVALAGTVGLLSVPANLLAVPAVAPATVLGVGCALLAPVCLPLAQAVAWLAWLPSAWLVLVARRGAALPGGQLPWPDGQGGALLLVVATLLVVVVLRRRLLRQVVAVSLVGVLLAVAGLGALRPGWPPHGWFMVSCSIGQGDASVFSLGAGRALVVDAGPDPRAVDRCLRRLDVREVPLVVLTHLHADHVDGLPGVLRGRAVGLVEVGPLDEPEAQWREVQEQAAAAGVPVRPAAVGSVRTAGRVRWEVLAPDHAFHGTSSDPNNSSLVLRVEVGGVRLLLTGDVEPEAQRELVRSGADLHVDVLKVPHHGSRHQDPGFLEAVRPRLALTSVGRDNGYGHPSSRTLGQLMDEGARSYRTDRDGDTALALREGQLVSAGHDGDGQLRGPVVTAAGRRAPGARGGTAGRRETRTTGSRGLADHAGAGRLGDRGRRDRRHGPGTTEPAERGARARHAGETRGTRAVPSVAVVSDLFDGYRSGGAFDELFAAPGVPHPTSAGLHAALQALSAGELDARAVALARAFTDQGITFSHSGQERPFPLDLVPRIVSGEEWDEVSRGVAQRVLALEAFLADVHGSQQVLQDGVVPRRVVLSSSAYTRAAAGVTPANGVRVHVSGVDLVRDEQGRFRVLEDNLRTPSGVSYVVENRRAMARVFPELLATHRVRPVSDYPARLLHALRAAAPAGVHDPTVVVLTPGVYNAAYFEHSLLARLMGVELVEGRDLTCREGVVWMRTTAGEQRVDVVYRRVDDAFLDPGPLPSRQPRRLPRHPERRPRREGDHRERRRERGRRRQAALHLRAGPRPLLPGRGAAAGQHRHLPPRGPVRARARARAPRQPGAQAGRRLRRQGHRHRRPGHRRGARRPACGGRGRPARLDRPADRPALDQPHPRRGPAGAAARRPAAVRRARRRQGLGAAWRAHPGRPARGVARGEQQPGRREQGHLGARRGRGGGGARPRPDPARRPPRRTRARPGSAACTKQQQQQQQEAVPC